jgi:hypothetical protein
MDTPVLDEGFALAHLVCTALEKSAFAVVGQETGEAIYTKAGRVGFPYAGFSGGYAQTINACTALIYSGRVDNYKDLRLTPIPGAIRHKGKIGGAAQENVYVAVDKLTPTQNRALAVVVLYHCLHSNLKLHHVGFSYSDEKSYQRANSKFQAGGEISKNGVAHTFFKIPNEGSFFYREHLFNPYSSRNKRVHLDFVCEDPPRFIWFVAGAFGQIPVVCPDVKPDETAGYVCLGDEFEITTRAKWLNVSEQGQL